MPLTLIAAPHRSKPQPKPQTRPIPDDATSDSSHDTHPKAAAARKIIREAEGRAEAAYLPIVNLVLPIVATSWVCTQALLPHLRRNPQVPDLQTQYVFCEFLYFFMHIMNRHARSRLSPQQAKTLQEVIEPEVVWPSVVQAFIGHWSQQSKEKIFREILQKVRDSDAEYLSDTDRALTILIDNPLPAPVSETLRIELALSLPLAVNVIELANGRDKRSQLGPMIQSHVMEALSTGNLKAFGELVESASVAIESSPTLPQLLCEAHSAIYGASPSPTEAMELKVSEVDADGAVIDAIMGGSGSAAAMPPPLPSPAQPDEAIAPPPSSKPNPAPRLSQWEVWLLVSVGAVGLGLLVGAVTL